MDGNDTQSQKHAAEEEAAINARRQRLLDRAVDAISIRQDARDNAAAILADRQQARSEERPAPSSDPLNLKPENAKRARDWDKAKHKKLRKERLPNEPRTAGERYNGSDVVVAEDGMRAIVRTRSHDAVRRLPLHLQGAMDRFEADWLAVQGGRIGSPDFEMKVDGGGSTRDAAHARRVHAVLRMKQARALLGEGDWVLLIAIGIFDFSMAEIHAAGGQQNIVVMDRFKAALTRLTGFYESPPDPYLDRTVKAAKQLIDDVLRRS